MIRIQINITTPNSPHEAMMIVASDDAKALNKPVLIFLIYSTNIISLLFRRFSIKFWVCTLNESKTEALANIAIPTKTIANQPFTKKLANAITPIVLVTRIINEKALKFSFPLRSEIKLIKLPMSLIPLVAITTIEKINTTCSFEYSPARLSLSKIFKLSSDIKNIIVPKTDTIKHTIVVLSIAEILLPGISELEVLFSLVA